MLETTHVLIALVLAKKIPNPLLAFGVGLVSHFVLDAIPHYDFQSQVLKPEYYRLDAKKGLAKKEFSRIGRIVIFSDLAVSFVIFLFLSFSGRIWPNFPDPSSFFNFLSLNLNLVAGVFGGILPDLITLVCFKIGFCRPKCFFEFHKNIQVGKEIEPRLGLILQAALCFFCLWTFMK